MFELLKIEFHDIAFVIDAHVKFVTTNGFELIHNFL